MNNTQKTKINKIASFITNQVKPSFEILIKEATTENEFPVVNMEDFLFSRLLKSATVYLEGITSLLIHKEFISYFNDIYDLCYSLLCKDRTLDKIATIYAEVFRRTSPSVSIKTKISNFMYEIRRNEEYFIPIVCLSTLNLANWPFNEIETINIMVALSFNKLIQSKLKSCLRIFELYENAGIDLSHLDKDKIAKKFYKPYLSVLCDPVIIAFFLYRNKDLRDALMGVLKLKALTNDTRSEKIKEGIKIYSNFMKVLEMTIPRKDRNLMEKRKKDIEKRVKDELKLFADRYMREQSIYLSVQNWKSSIKSAFEQVTELLRVEAKDSGLNPVHQIHFNFGSIKSSFEQSITSSYREIIKLMAEERFDSVLTNKVLHLATLITAWKITHSIEKSYLELPLVDFLYFLAGRIYISNVSDFFCKLTASKLVEKLKEADYIVEKELEYLKDSRSISPEKLTLQVRKILAECRLYDTDVENLIDNIKTSIYKNNESKINHLLRKLFKNYSGSFYVVIITLAKTSYDVYLEEKEKGTGYYTEWFARKFEKVNNLNDVYKAIITGRVTSTNTLEKLRGLHVLLIIADVLRQKLDYTFKYWLCEDGISLMDNSLIGPNMKDIMVSAFIAARLLRSYRRKCEEEEITEKVFNITIDSDGIPVIEGIALLSFDDIRTYFSRLIDT